MISEVCNEVFWVFFLRFEPSKVKKDGIVNCGFFYETLKEQK